MRELDVVGVRVDVPSNAPILLLQESGGSRVIPIWIGAAEASAIANALEGVVPPRPLTHDLMAQLLSELGHTQVSARITAMKEGPEEGGIFHAELEVDGHVLSARPSDVVALAVRSGIVITAPEELLDQVGVELEQPAQDEVERFREFLDSVSPDDFEES
ncbi:MULTISPECIES: bifunctional nuclease family protein [unclassified Luteococcus]|uniref:bifunctional nuclease family protein n=1 Tax=unclassified Luteococcus TaxID=2639923 RepID=UPI00313CFC40